MCKLWGFSYVFSFLRVVAEQLQYSTEQVAPRLPELLQPHRDFQSHLASGEVELLSSGRLLQVFLRTLLNFQEFSVSDVS